MTCIEPASDAGFYPEGKQVIRRPSRPEIPGMRTPSKPFQKGKSILPPEVIEELKVQLDEFVFKAGEDPAIPIIRKAIEKRSSYKNKNVNYEAELYIKGLIKLTDAPEKLFGRELGNLDGILDSSRQGILYL